MEKVDVIKDFKDRVARARPTKMNNKQDIEVLSRFVRSGDSLIGTCLNMVNDYRREILDDIEAAELGDLGAITGVRYGLTWLEVYLQQAINNVKTVQRLVEKQVKEIGE